MSNSRRSWTFRWLLVAIVCVLVLCSFLILPRHSWLKHSERKWEQEIRQRHKILEKNPLVLEQDIGNVGKLFTASFNCPFSLNRIGREGDGGKWVCGIERLPKPDSKEPCIIYSFGVNDDSSFEAELHNKTNCVIHAYDPTVSTIGKPLNELTPRVHFQKVGIGSTDTTTGIMLKTLKTLMKSNGHQWLDILKIDAEGHEYDSLTKALEDFDEIPFRQLLVEFHAWKPHYPDALVEVFENLERGGMRAFHFERNPNNLQCYEYSFLNVKSF